MPRSTEYPKTPLQVKRELKRLGISQRKAAESIGKSNAMVSMTLSGDAKSEPVLAALRKLIASAKNGEPLAA